MMRSRSLAALVLATVASAACGGSTIGDAGDLSTGGSSQGSGGDASGGVGSGGAAVGSGGIIIIGGGGYPPNPLTEECTATPESSDYGRARAQEACYAVEVFYTEGREADGHFEFPTFPEAATGGAGGAGHEPLAACPLPSDLEWSCRPL